MRILQIVPVYYPAVQWGGPALSVHLLNKALACLNQEVVVYTTAFGCQENRDQEECIDGVKVARFKFFTIKRWFFSLSLLKRLWQTCGSFDLVHINLIWDPVCWLSAVIIAFKRRPMIISPRGSIGLSLVKKQNRFWKTIVYLLILKPLFKRTAAFHFTSAYEQEKFVEFTGLQKTAQIIFNPLEIELFKEMADKNSLRRWGFIDHPFFLFLSRINWIKGLELLIESFERFTVLHPEVLLVIAGSGEEEYETKIRQLVEAKGLSAQVVFTGFVAGKEKLALLQQAIAFILPSSSENFGMAVVEAMAAGAPVIVSSGVGLKDVIEKYNAGLVFDINNNAEQNLFEQMQKLTSNPQLRFSLVENGRKLVQEQFNPEAVARQMEKFYYASLHT